MKYFIIISLVVMFACKKEEVCEIDPNWIELELNENHFACNKCKVIFWDRSIHTEIRFYSDGKKEPKRLIYEKEGRMDSEEIYFVPKGYYYRLECKNKATFKKRDV